MEAPAEIKVKTRKFSLTKGTIKISFELEGSRGRIRSLKLKQRNAVLDTSFPFEMQTAKKGNTIVYHAQINVDQYPMETAFWDVVASVDKEGKGNYEDAILGGLSSKLKLKLILFPRWTRTGDGHMVYPFVNGARQFTIQYRKYDPKYDSSSLNSGSTFLGVLPVKTSYFHRIFIFRREDFIAFEFHLL